jgi:hypothetical protein|tara:strand:- start:28 stop:1023 length:996 start_codon:yes stop_codon:yes gene_type:complete
MISCRDPKNGFHAYYCKDCNISFIRPHSCNSRACSACGKNHTEKWTEKTVKRMFDVNHSHIIFTLPKVLWNLVKDNPKCVKELSDMTFKVVRESMSRVAKKEIKPGEISAFHSYGDEMNVNTHFHTIVTEGGNDKNGNWKKVDYIPYRIVRFKWRDEAVRIIKKHVEMTKENQMIFEMIDVTYRNGFNVRREKGGIPKKELIAYIARYVRHPPISNRRIIDYNGKGVTIVCKNPKRFVTMTVEEFIRRLLLHIPPKNFKIIRYYGLYSRISKAVVKLDRQESLFPKTIEKYRVPCVGCKKMLEPIGYYAPYSHNGPPNEYRFGMRITEWIS